MKSIAQFVADGITTLADLKAALQTAMKLEFATIPPYLCAEWSINNDPSNVSGMIQTIVVQEMYHFAMAGNMLSAIDGKPSVANASFIPAYPTNELPGGIHQGRAIDLQPLSSDQLEVFMQIEYPDFPPIVRTATPPATIGAFYDTISAGFAAVNPTINSAAYAVDMDEAVPITSVADAQTAIARIKAEGEGTRESPDQPFFGDAQFAHYYVFKEIHVGKTLVQTDGKWGFTGSTIEMPTVYPFSQSTAVPDPSLPFNQALSQLLIDLQSCWTSTASPSIGDMYGLRKLGVGLIKEGIRPGFSGPGQPADNRERLAVSIADSQRAGRRMMQEKKKGTVQRTWLGLRAFLSPDVSAAGLVGPDGQWRNSAQFARVQHLRITLIVGAVPAIACGPALLYLRTGKSEAVSIQGPSIWWYIVAACLSGTIYAFFARLAMLVSLSKERRDFSDEVTVVSAQNELRNAEATVAGKGDGASLTELWTATQKRIDLYHKIATSEAKRSFFNAQLAAAGGFLIVIAAAIAAAAAKSTTASIATGATGAVGGALGGFVGRTFIQMQQEAESNLRTFFQQPVQVLQTLLAERMAKLRVESK